MEPNTDTNRYFHSSVDNVYQRRICLNGHSVVLELKGKIEAVKAFFSTNSKTYTEASQCDPNDLNICEDGMILDFLGGGYTPYDCCR